MRHWIAKFPPIIAENSKVCSLFFDMAALYRSGGLFRRAEGLSAMVEYSYPGKRKPNQTARSSKLEAIGVTWTKIIEIPSFRRGLVLTQESLPRTGCCEAMWRFQLRKENPRSLHTHFEERVLESLPI